jgi:hypothetical protein
MAGDVREWNVEWNVDRWHYPYVDRFTELTTVAIGHPPRNERAAFADRLASHGFEHREAPVQWLPFPSPLRIGPDA